MVIYKVINKIKIIKNFKYMKSMHQWSNANHPFYRTIKKYGRCNFILEAIKKHCSKEEMDKKDYGDVDLSEGNLSNCAIDRYSQHKGYKCRYCDENVDVNIPVWEA